MGDCVRRVWNGTEENETLKEAIMGIIKWLKRAEKKQVGEWVEKVSYMAAGLFVVKC